jgi:hypothetical protein
MSVIDDTIKLTQVLLSSDRPRLRQAAQLAIGVMNGERLAKAIAEVLALDSPPVSSEALATRVLDLHPEVKGESESFSDFLTRVKEVLRHKGYSSPDFLGELKRGPTANDGSQTSTGYRHDLVNSTADSAGMSFSMYDIALSHRQNPRPDPVAAQSISLALSSDQVAAQAKAAEKQQPALSPAKHAECMALMAGVATPSCRTTVSDTHLLATRTLGKGLQFSTEAPAAPSQQEADEIMANLGKLAELAPYVPDDVRQSIVARTREFYDASVMRNVSGTVLQESRELLARARATIR